MRVAHRVSFAKSEGAASNYLAAIRTRTESAPFPMPTGFWNLNIAKMLLLAVVALAASGGVLVTDGATTSRAIAGAGGDWANLLRAMAVLKLLFAGVATAVILWRLDAPLSAIRWGGYALAAAVTWAGPGLIFGLAHVRLGTLLLHGGLVTTAVLIWRDPATSARLSEMIARRRAILRRSYSNR